MGQHKQKKTKLRSVLVTRPVHQSEGFIKLLQNAGCTAVEFPVIDIELINTDLTATQHSDLIIFTSANAVAGANLNKPLPWQSNARIAAIGRVTALSLTKLNCEVNILPPVKSNTEALLDVIGDVTKLNITIIRGDSGRELLHQELTRRGASVTYQTVYHRTQTLYSQAHINALFKEGLPDIITVSSDLGLTNLINIIPPELQTSLRSRPLVVNSKRCAQLATDRGFCGAICVADPPGDDSQLQEILSLR